MIDNLKTAFDCIHADDQLKANTLLYLQGAIQNPRRTSRKPARRFAALASTAAVLLIGVFSFTLYLTPTAYVDLDVNPSIGLTLNRFDRVIGARAYNGDGEGLLSGLSLMHKNYDDALMVLIEALNQEGYIQSSGLVSVTLRTNRMGREAALLSRIETDVADYVDRHCHGAQVDVFSVSGDTWGHARELGVSPAKYLAIQAVIETDPSVTVESCRDHSISELRQWTRMPMGGRSGNNGGHHSGGHE